MTHTFIMVSTSLSPCKVWGRSHYAPAVGAKIWCLLFFVCHTSRRAVRSRGITIRRGIVSLFMGRFGFCFHISFRWDCLFSCTRKCPFPSPVEATIFQKLTETFLRTTSCRQLREFKKCNRNTLQPGTLMCTPCHLYIFFPRAAIQRSQNLSKFVQVVQKWLGKNKFVRTKSPTESLPKYICVVVHARDVVVHSYCGIRWRHSRAEFRTANFRQFCNTLKERQRRQLWINLEPFPPSVRGVLYNALNVLQFHRQLAAQHSQSCGGNFTKRNNWPLCLCQIFPMFITEIAINSTRGRLTLYPAGMHCPRWCFWFLVCFEISTINN